MIPTGQREARVSWLGRLMARAGARELAAFVVPGPDVARSLGVDFEAAGLPFVDTPRHASVLVLVGEVPAGLVDAAAVAYAQMPRPRALMSVGAGDVSPLPEPDVSVPLEQEALVGGAAELRRSFARNAFGSGAADFDVEAVRTRTEYVCPMHPEVARDEPGSCPICGMDLVPGDAAMGAADHGSTGRGAMDHGAPGNRSHGTAEHEHGGHEQGDHGSMRHEEAGPGDDSGEHDAMGDHDDDGDREEHSGHGSMGHDGSGQGQEDPDEGEGSAEDEQGHDGGHGGMEHGGTDHGDMGFMSMVMMTEGTPRSSDELQMEWARAPFGPLFPGLPAGLSLALTLDGDTVAEVEAGPEIEGWSPVVALAGPADGLAGRLARLNPLSPVAYGVLALRALEDAAGAAPEERVALARAGALELERAASHLGWLASFAHLVGYRWLEERAARLQLALLGAANATAAASLAGEARRLRRRVERTPLLRRKLAWLGELGDGVGVVGPLARAAGRSADARIDEEAYRSLGFEPVVFEGDDALSRLRVRLAEAEQSLGLVGRAGAVAVPDSERSGPVSGAGSATLETPRGAATLRAAFENGEVVGAELDTPSTRHAGLIEPVTEQQELANALVGVASLDLSPWEVVR